MNVTSLFLSAFQPLHLPNPDPDAEVTPPEEEKRTVEERLDALEKRVRYISERLRIVQREDSGGE